MERIVPTTSHASGWTGQKLQAVHVRQLVRTGGPSGQSAEGSSYHASRFDTAAKPKTIGILVFQHMTATDLMGPAETFFRSVISTDNDRDRRCYRVVTIGVNTEDCVTESGITVKPQIDTQHAPPLDTLILPGGGNGIHDARLAKKVGKWLRTRTHTTRRIASLGSGIYALAASGLLDGRHVTTHWRLAKDIALRFPKLRINSNVLFVKDGPFYTCAGGASAIDLCLALIEEDYGRPMALTLARELLVYVKRPGEQDQYSEPLRFQVQSSDRFADLPAWIFSHLSDDLSIDVLAQRAAMSRRNFTRLFHKAFGKTPAQFVAEVRIAEAQQRLLVPRNSIESVAHSLGFRSADVFSVAFERYTGIRPRIYRALRRVPKSNGSTKAQPSKSVVRAKRNVLRAA